MLHTLSRSTATSLQVCLFSLTFTVHTEATPLEWIAGDDTLQSNWTATDDGSIVYLQTQLASPTPFRELNDRPMDGIAYHAMLHVCGPSQSA